MKVFELAKELDIGAIELVDKLQSMGMNVKSHMVKLNDDQLSQAKLAFAPAAEPAKKKAKKKVVKKKVAKKKVVKKAAAATEGDEEKPKVAKKKVAKKKVLVKKKVSAVTDEVEETEPVEEASVEAVETVDTAEDTAAKKKTVLVKKEDKELKKAEMKAAREDKKKDYLDEKVHTFTPVFVPPEEERQKNAKANTTPGAPKKADDINDKVFVEGGDKNKTNKRMGDLAAMVSKKSTASKAQDITQMRISENMKLAQTLVGSTIYTPAKRKKQYVGPTKSTMITEVKDSKRVVNVHGIITAEDLARKLGQKLKDLKNECLKLNLLIGNGDQIGVQLATEIATLYKYRVEDRSFNEDEVIGKDSEVDKSDFPVRNPIITVMGHVDHGKTTLLDFIRKEKVASGEAGGITQHIGAYSVPVNDGILTFLDTPGHAAFANMRQRGANVTDIVILVVAADDGVMPQTVESIKFCKNAEVPLIIAVNKMDKEGVNPDRVKQELMEHGITAEDWGGDTQFYPISALKGDGVDGLLEGVLLLAEMLELREDPKGSAEGVVIESKIETGRGAVSTILVQSGTLNKGDSIVVGETYGRARNLMDSTGKMIKSAGPSTPVQILGLTDVASPGDVLNVVKNEREAKKIAENRINDRKKLENAPVTKVASLEDFFKDAGTVEGGEKKVLKLIVRADVHGSYEAIKTAVEQLGNEEVGVQVIGGGVGAITENDVMLAATSGYIIGFNMRPVTSARKLAETEGVDIKTYSIIYELISDITLALEGMLEPDYVEKFIGRAEVRQTFSIPKIGTIAGSAVIDGKIERGCKIRLLRDGKILHDGKLSTLKRFKDEVKEVKSGYECGIALENYNDVKESDIFEAYIMEEVKRSLESSGNVTL